MSMIRYKFLLNKSTYVDMSFGVLLTSRTYEIIIIMINPINKTNNTKLMVEI